MKGRHYLIYNIYITEIMFPYNSFPSNTTYFFPVCKKLACCLQNRTHNHPDPHVLLVQGG